MPLCVVIFNFVGLGITMKNSYRFVFRITCLLASCLAAASVHALEPIPSFYQEPGLPSNRATVNQSLGEHIDPFTGKLQLHFTDLVLPGNGGLDIRVQRSYNSQEGLLQEQSATGVGWTMHFGRVLRRASVEICTAAPLASDAPVLELQDGSRQILYLSDDRTFYLSPERWRATCAPGGGGLTVFSPDGMVYEMTSRGVDTGPINIPAARQSAYYTTRMTDRNGNTLNFTYVTAEAATGVAQVTSSDGRTVTFNYLGNRLDNITDGERIWRYSYDTSAGPSYPFLTQVTRPDGTVWKFDYDLVASNDPGAYSLKRATYPTGGTIDYSYGFVNFSSTLPKSTVVSRKVGVGGTWTYSYNPATIPAARVNGFFVFDQAEMLDRTLVSAPDGMHTYYHVGANSIGFLGGGVYTIGLMMIKSIDSGYENEYRDWSAQKIASAENIRPGAEFVQDADINAPLLAKITIQRNGQNYTTDYSNFDQYGNPQIITETGTESRVTNLVYETFPGKWILRSLRSQAVSTVPGESRWTYDTNGNMLSETRYGVSTQFTYNPQGDIATKKDARGNTMTYLEYFRGTPRMEQHPEAVNITRTIFTTGNIASQTDGEGTRTSYAYDGLNRLLSIVHPAGNPVAVTWSANNRIVRRGAYTETTNYDAYGRVANVTVNGGSSGPITQTSRYDALDRKIFASYPNRSTGTFFRYDALGRNFATYHVAQIANNANGFTFTGGRRTSYFDTNKVLSTNERNLTYDLRYRGYGSADNLDLLQVLAPDPTANIQITRNGLGQILTVEQGGLTRTNQYDTRYFLVGSTIPETGVSIYGVDEIGNMISRKVGASPITLYSYDGRNRMKTTTYPSGTPSVTKTYNKDDTLQSIDNGVTKRTYTYTPNKKLQHEDLTVDAKLFAVDYVYDGNDALNTVSYSTGLTQTYVPDALGRPTVALPFANAVSFHPNGLVSRIAYGNGVVSDFAINERLWPSNVVTAKPNSAALINLTNSYDFSGNVTNIADAVNGQQNRTFGYDALDRLANVTLPGVVGGSISYNGRGNITAKNFGSFALNYQYDAANKLAAVTGSRSLTFGYDVYGNVAASGRNQFTYDDASYLRCVDCATPNRIDYVYDGMGTRVSQKTSAETTYFMYGNNGELLFDVDASGTKREYGYVAGRNIAKKESR